MIAILMRVNYWEITEPRMLVQNAPQGPVNRAWQPNHPTSLDGRPISAPAGQPNSQSSPRRSLPAVLIGVVLIALANTTSYSAVTPTEDPPTTERPEFQTDDNNFLILEAQMGNFLLTDGMAGYLNEGSLLLPLSEFSEILDLAIGVSPGTGKADGWFLNENRLFSLDIDRGTAVIDGKTRSINPLLIAVFDDDIYVDVRMLADWFPIDIKFELSNLIIRFKSREPFPIEQKLSRSSRRSKILSKKEAQESRFPKLPQPYQLISWPVSDSSMQFSFRKSDSGDTRSINQTTFMTAEVGKLSAELFLNADDQSFIPQARLKVGRKDPNGELLGDFEATEFAMGDVSTPSTPLVATSNLGRGVFLSNLPLDNPSEFDRITLDGELPTGWDVELYRNEVLLDFRTSRADGRYVFEDVPLLFGVNVLRIAFFGPQGQTRNDIRQIRVGPDQTKPGEFRYRFAANQQGRQLLIGDVDTTTEDGTEGKLNLLGEFSTGITRNLSFAASFTSVPLEDGTHQYVTASTRTAIGNVFGRLDVVRDLSEGWALQIGAQTSFAGITTIAEHIRLYDFESGQYEPSSDPTEHETTARLEGTVKIPGLAQIPFSFSGTHEQTRAGTTSTSLNNRLSTAISGASITNSLRWQLDKSETSKTTTVDGNFLVGGRLQDVRVRGQLSYAVTPDPDISTGSVSADWRVNTDLNASAGVTKDFSDDGATTLSSGLNSTFDLAAVGLNFDYSTANDLNARLNLSFSSTRDPRSGKLVVRAESMADAGSISVRVFLDENYNGVFDEGDTPLEGIQFKADGSSEKPKTGKDGIAFLSGLETYRNIDIELDKGTMEDPYWVSAPEGVSVVLRPGIAAQAEFPVVTTGEIDGTVYRRNGEWANEVRDVIVQLVKADGSVAHQTESAYDGFYLLDFVRPGTYTLRVDPEQIRKLRLSPPKEQQVVIEGDGTILNSLDIILESDRVSRSFRVLLTSFKTRAQVKDAWELLKEQHPKLLEGLQPMIQLNDVGGDQGVVFDLFAGPLENKKTASDLCVNIRQVRSEVWCNPLTIQAR